MAAELLRPIEAAPLAELTALLFETQLRRHAEIVPLAVARDATLLQRLGRSLQSLAIAHCNHGLTARQERRQKSLCEHASAVASRYDATVDCGGDPRGYVLKIILPTGRYNTWGGKESGWGIG